MDREKGLESRACPANPPSALNLSSSVEAPTLLQKCLIDLTSVYPEAHYLGCSTSSEICGTQVLDDSLVVTAICFQHTELRGTP